MRMNIWTKFTGILQHTRLSLKKKKKKKTCQVTSILIFLKLPSYLSTIWNLIFLFASPFSFTQKSHWMESKTVVILYSIKSWGRQSHRSLFCKVYCWAKKQLYLQTVALALCNKPCCTWIPELGSRFWQSVLYNYDNVDWLETCHIKPCNSWKVIMSAH